MHRLQVLGGGIALGQEELLHLLVLAPEQQHAVGHLAVAARAAGFLVVGLEVARHLVVHDEAHVGLVDAHAEGVGGDHHAAVAAHERVLAGVALQRRHAAVIARDRFAGGAQPVVHLLAALHRRGVDDAAAVRVRQRLAQPIELLFLAGGLHDLEAQVRPVDAGVDDVHARPPELLADVLDHVGDRGGGEREHRRIAELLQRIADLQEGGPEVVAPLRDAVRLVHHEQRDAPPLQGGHELRVGQALRRGEDDGIVGHRDALQRCLLLVARLRAVHLLGGHPGPLQLLGLVLHERDERRHHHRRALEVQRRKLIAQRLAGTGGHDGQRVAAFQHARDDLLLAVVQPDDAEGLAQRLPHGRRDGGCRHVGDVSKGRSRRPERCSRRSDPAPRTVLHILIVCNTIAPCRKRRPC